MREMSWNESFLNVSSFWYFSNIKGANWFKDEPVYNIFLQLLLRGTSRKIETESSYRAGIVETCRSRDWIIFEKINNLSTIFSEEDIILSEMNMVSSFAFKHPKSFIRSLVRFSKRAQHSALIDSQVWVKFHISVVKNEIRLRRSY